MRNKRKVGVAGPIVVLAALCSSAWAQECPPGSRLDHVQRSGDEEHTYCKCLPGYVARGGQCVLKLPVVDPAFFIPSDHLAFVKAELERLRSRKERLERELEKLNRLREGQDDYLQEMGEMREQLVYDCVGDLLSVASSKEFLTRIPGISAHDVEELGNATKAMKSAVDAVASALAGKDRERERQKALDATGTSLSVLAKISAPAEQKEALSKLVDVSSEILKAVDANRRVDNVPLRDRVAKALDSAAAIAGAAYEPLGAARSLVNATGAGIVIWKIQNAKESIVEALVSSQRAKLATDQRLAATEELINFYEVELKKAGKEGG